MKSLKFALAILLPFLMMSAATAQVKFAIQGDADITLYAEQFCEKTQAEKEANLLQWHEEHPGHYVDIQTGEVLKRPAPAGTSYNGGGEWIALGVWQENQTRRMADGSVATIAVARRVAPTVQKSVTVRSSNSCSSGSCSTSSSCSTGSCSASSKSFFGRVGDRIRNRRADRRERRAVRSVSRL